MTSEDALVNDMLEPLFRDDVPRGLIFTLGYRAKPGSRFVFLKSTDARQVGGTTGDFYDQSRASLDFLKGLAAEVSPQARIVKVRRYMTSGRGHRTPETSKCGESARVAFCDQ